MVCRAAIARPRQISRSEVVAGTSCMNPVNPLGIETDTRHDAKEAIVETCQVGLPHLAGDDLIFFVPFTRDEHQISRSRRLDRLSNRLATIHDRQNPLSGVALAAAPRCAKPYPSSSVRSSP